ncbi:hypothetical protein [Streptomyces sp. NPDC058695]|uniref:hypothetical protein n=1 Tax=Streptomyces sp. NPDC058695 TaxID=3346604 RepID=UPI0036477585
MSAKASMKMPKPTTQVRTAGLRPILDCPAAVVVAGGVGVDPEGFAALKGAFTGSGAAQGCERGFRAQTFRVVAGRGQELSGGLGAHAEQR